MKTYYETQSSGRYSIDGETTDWVKVPFNEARYGRSNGYPCDDIVCDNTWALVQDGMNQWVADQQAAGVSDEEIARDPRQLRRLGSLRLRRRRRLQRARRLHRPPADRPRGRRPGRRRPAAGRGRHLEPPLVRLRQRRRPDRSRRRTSSAAPRSATPASGPATTPMQPENGGLSTIAHEYGHDLGLPDHYDTAGGQNGVEWWTLMAQSRLAGRGRADRHTGRRPVAPGTSSQLGWLDYEVTVAGTGPRRSASARPSTTPVARRRVTVAAEEDRDAPTTASPYAGERFWWSTSGDDLTTRP